MFKLNKQNGILSLKLSPAVINQSSSLPHTQMDFTNTRIGKNNIRRAVSFCDTQTGPMTAINAEFLSKKMNIRPVLSFFIFFFSAQGHSQNV